MTSNQLRFWDLEETKRNNRKQLEELNRHQVATEAETKRANRTKEWQNTLNLLQQERMNNETIHNNKIVNTERNRSNLANENIAMYNAQTNRMQILNSQSIQKGQLSELSRSNRAREAQNLISLSNERDKLNETRRANNLNYQNNLLHLRETTRSNKANEAIKRVNADISLRDVKNREGQLVEQTRSNLAKEAISRGQLQETQRSNKTREIQSWVEIGTNSLNNLLRTGVQAFKLF